MGTVASGTPSTRINSELAMDLARKKWLDDVNSRDQSNSVSITSTNHQKEDTFLPWLPAIAFPKTRWGHELHKKLHLSGSKLCFDCFRSLVLLGFLVGFFQFLTIWLMKMEAKRSISLEARNKFKAWQKPKSTLATLTIYHGYWWMYLWQACVYNMIVNVLYVYYIYTHHDVSFMSIASRTVVLKCIG